MDWEEIISVALYTSSMFSETFSYASFPVMAENTRRQFLQEKRVISAMTGNPPSGIVCI